MLNPRPSISFVLHDGWTLGGTTTWAVQMATEFANRGWPVHLLVHRNPAGKPWQIDSKIHVHQVGGYTAWFPRYAYLHEFVDAYRKVLPGIIVPNSSSGTYAACAELTKTNASDIRVIGTLHTDWEGCFEWCCYYQSILSSQIAVSSRIKNKLEARLSGRHAPIHVRPYPGSRDGVVRSGYSPSGAPVVVGYAGRLQEEQKRFSDVIRVAAELNQLGVCCQIHVFGGGKAEDEASYRELAAKLPGDKQQQIIFHGIISAEQMRARWKEFDICLMTSEYEGASITLIEACMAGTVPVVTDVSGTDDLIDQDTGFVCPVGDVQGLASAIAALAVDRERLARMGRAASQKVRDLCDFQDYVDWFEKLCEQAWHDEPPKPWPRWKPTICMTQTMKEAGFDPGPANMIQRAGRKLRRLLPKRQKNRS